MAIRDFPQSGLDNQGVPHVVSTEGSYPGGSGVLHQVLHESTLTNSVACSPNRP